jgi:predicted ester cyclase
MSNSKIIALIAVISLAFAATAINNAVADEARNELIIERNLAEIWHKGNFDVMEEIVAANYVRHMPGGVDFRGHEGYKKHVLGFITPFPDLRWIMDIMVSKGDYVVVRYSGSATHTGEGLGPPTGKKVTFTAIVIHRLAGDKMAECWVEVDNLSFMTQLGYKLVPPSK